MKALRCGECGGNTFHIIKHDPDKELYTELVAECLGCCSKTIIKPTPVSIQFNWYKDSEGILCDFGDKE
jgi:DNA-directed RNA polymerase subunit RPC12/RpoP